jgi:hypothetical protein
VRYLHDTSARVHSAGLDADPGVDPPGDRLDATDDRIDATDDRIDGAHYGLEGADRRGRTAARGQPLDGSHPKGVGQAGAHQAADFADAVQLGIHSDGPRT